MPLFATCTPAIWRKSATWPAVSGRDYHDYRTLLEDKDVNAVIVATNAHWHVLCTIGACQAGKDVYVEKPLSNFVGEGRFAVAAAKKYDRIVQIGTQQHSREHYKKAVEVIQSGRLGNIVEVRVMDVDRYDSLGRPADCDPPPELDWDFYVGPSPMMQYNPSCYDNYGYDWFKISGAGHQVAWGVHHFDIVNWAMGVKWPKAVSASGGKFAFDDNRQWPDTFSAIAEYGPGPVAKTGFLLQYTMRIGNRFDRRSHSKCFLGTSGSLLLDRGRYSIVGESLRNGKKLMPDEEVLASNDESRHTQVFLDNVRNHKWPIDDVETGYYATNVGHLMNVSYEVGRKIRWDGEKELVIDDSEANARVHRQYRARGSYRSADRRRVLWTAADVAGRCDEGCVRRRHEGETQDGSRQVVVRRRWSGPVRRERSGSDRMGR